jgi:xyloglucan-specific endo-beta-1,4-glucanase
MGANTNGQFVYSWLASGDLSSFSGDISPLLHYLWRHSYISKSTYLGIVQFGSEAFHATSNVTFMATDFSIGIKQGTPASESVAATLLAELPFLSITMLITTMLFWI